MGIRRETIPFQSLEFGRTPWTRWVSSVVIHTAAFALILSIPVAVKQQIQEHRQVSDVVLYAPPPPPPPPPPLRMVVKMKPPEPLPVVPPVRPKLTFKPPKPQPEEVKKVVVPPPVPAEPPKPIEAAKLETPKLDIPAPARPVIKEEVFASNRPAPVAPSAPIKSVTPGGFGDVNGVPASASSSKGLTVPKVGSFDLPAGSGNGGSPGGGPKAVASAGFGTAGTTGAAGGVAAGGNGRGTVQSAGFGAYEPAPSAPKQANKPVAPAETPVEIVYKPKPEYTPAAREKRLEGEVQFEVLFSASGRVQVLRLLRGLGYGLDETARTAAEQIRFRPGMRDGQPVDMKGTVHIVFELS